MSVVLMDVFLQGFLQTNIAFTSQAAKDSVRTTFVKPKQSQREKKQNPKKKVSPKIFVRLTCNNSIFECKCNANFFNNRKEEQDKIMQPKQVLHLNFLASVKNPLFLFYLAIWMHHFQKIIVAQYVPVLQSVRTYPCPLIIASL